MIGEVFRFDAHTERAIRAWRAMESAANKLNDRISKMASLGNATVKVEVVDERVEVALRILTLCEDSELADEARKFLLATVREWNGRSVETDVSVAIKGECQFQRWHKGDSQGGMCPAKQDAPAVIAVLEEALDVARRMICVDQQMGWDGAPIPGESLPFATVPPDAVRELTEAVIGPGEKPRTQLVDGEPVPEDGSHTKLKPNGQQVGYVVLTPEERAKGFVRPVRRSYRHVGTPGPKHPLRDFDPETEAHHIKFGYVKFEAYTDPNNPSVCGRCWTQDQLDAIGKGCGCVTTMSLAIAETYAREPKFYGGTFCSGCGKHLPVGESGEFVWEGTDERVGT